MKRKILTYHCDKLCGRPPQYVLAACVGREKLLLRCRPLGRASRLGAHGGGEGRGHIVAAARPPDTAC